MCAWLHGTLSGTVLVGHPHFAQYTINVTTIITIFIEVFSSLLLVLQWLSGSARSCVLGKWLQSEAWREETGFFDCILLVSLTLPEKFAASPYSCFTSQHWPLTFLVPEGWAGVSLSNITCTYSFPARTNLPPTEAEEIEYVVKYVAGYDAKTTNCQLCSCCHSKQHVVCMHSRFPGFSWRHKRTVIE